MKLLAIPLLACAAVLQMSTAEERIVDQQEQDFRDHVAQSIKKRVIAELSGAQHIAVCEPIEGKGHVIKTVLIGQIGVDHVGQLRIGDYWNSGLFPMTRILAVERFERGGTDGSAGTISSTYCYLIDEQERSAALFT